MTTLWPELFCVFAKAVLKARGTSSAEGAVVVEPLLPNWVTTSLLIWPIVVSAPGKVNVCQCRVSP